MVIFRSETWSGCGAYRKSINPSCILKNEQQRAQDSVFYPIVESKRVVAAKYYEREHRQQQCSREVPHIMLPSTGNCCRFLGQARRAGKVRHSLVAPKRRYRFLPSQLILLLAF